MSVEDREQIGRLCKHLIDHGRLYYLQQKGFETSLKYYTSRDSLIGECVTNCHSHSQSE